MQAYGLTETSAGISRPLGVHESQVIGSNGRLVSNCEARIVDPLTGHNLPPLQQGELWIRGPMVMKGKLSSLSVPLSFLSISIHIIYYMILLHWLMQVMWVIEKQLQQWLIQRDG